VNDTLIRWGGSRAVVSLSLKIIVILLLVGGVPLLAFWPFGKTHAPTVEVYDEANVLQDNGTASSLENLRFRKDVKLVVVTLDAGYNDNFNSAVLAYARQDHPEWISASNPNYWADGTVILGVSPKGRWTGCYFGEDVKVDLAIQQEIQDAGKDSFRQGLWAPGVERMAARTADVIGRPIPSDTAAVIISGIGAIGGLALGVVMLVRRSDAREAFTRARRHYTQVTTDYEGTQIKAGLIPTDDAHGAQILARFAWFEDRYAELTRAFYDFGEPRRAEWFEWDRKTDAERLEVRAAALDSLDDAISNASDLLTMSQSWREAWRNEQGPVREDLASFRKLCSSVQAKGELDITQERIWLKASLDRMAAMTNEMEAGALSPSAALDELDTISQDVRTRAESLARRALKADTSSYRNGRLHRYESSQSRRVRNSDAYAGWWLFDGHRISYDPASTIRINPSSVGANASGVHWTGAGSASHFSTPIADLVTGYSSAANWQPPSSSSSSSEGRRSSTDMGLWALTSSGTWPRRLPA